MTLRTALCARLGIEYPILLAGMGFRGKATPPALVAAVSEAGGLGVIGGSGLSAHELRRVIREVKERTRKPFGVDLLMPQTLKEASPKRSGVRAELGEKFPAHAAFVDELLARYDLSKDAIVRDEAVVSVDLIREQVDVVLDERVPVFAAALGDPSWVVPLAHERGIVVMGLVGTVRNAERQRDAGVDAIVAQGYEAGGHTGKVATLPLVPQIVDAVAPLPVIAAGGIGDGRGIAAALALGALGVWVGTAFLVAEECGIADVSKDAIVRSRSQDFEISRVYSGKTMRNLKSEIIDAWQNSGLEPLPMPYQVVLMDDFNAAVEHAGKMELYNTPAGQVGGMVTARKPAREIMRDLVEGTERALAALAARVQIEAMTAAP